MRIVALLVVASYLKVADAQWVLSLHMTVIAVASMLLTKVSTG